MKTFSFSNGDSHSNIQRSLQVSAQFTKVSLSFKQHPSSFTFDDKTSSVFYMIRPLFFYFEASYVDDDTTGIK